MVDARVTSAATRSRDRGAIGRFRACLTEGPEQTLSVVRIAYRIECASDTPKHLRRSTSRGRSKKPSAFVASCGRNRVGDHGAHRWIGVGEQLCDELRERPSVACFAKPARSPPPHVSTALVELVEDAEEILNGGGRLAAAQRAHSRHALGTVRQEKQPEHHGVSAAGR